MGGSAVAAWLRQITKEERSQKKREDKPTRDSETARVAARAVSVKRPVFPPDSHILRSIQGESNPVCRR